MNRSIDFGALLKPFKQDEIEWRLAQCGKSNGKIWGHCLAYITARAIMDRLDLVCGPENWKAEYDVLPSGILCRLSIRCEGEWVTKVDGAECTDIEPFKGGISSALKRAGSAWGMGRYLYSLENGFVTVVEKNTDGAKYGKTKDGDTFYWVPPSLPAWALPAGESPKGNGSIAPQNPNPNDPGEPQNHSPSGYVIDFGQWNKRPLEQIYQTHGPQKIVSYIDYLEDAANKKGQPIDPNGKVGIFIHEATNFLGAMENGATGSSCNFGVVE